MSAPQPAPNTTRRPRRRRPQGPAIAGGSVESRRLALVILEVLAGVRTPQAAAEALGLSPPRYYALEARALEGLREACEPRSPGRQPSPEREREQLQAQVKQFERENARLQALVRVAQRTVRLPAPTRTAPKTGRKAAAPGMKKRNKRKPTVRALKAARRLAAQEAIETATHGTGDEVARTMAPLPPAPGNGS